MVLFLNNVQERVQTMAKKKAVSKIKVTGDEPEAAPPDAGNKSAVIRAAIAAHPQAGPKEVADIVSKQLGQEVKASYVSIIKSQDKKKAGGKATGGKRGRKGGGAATAKSNGKAGTIPADLGNALDTVIAANKLLASAGSADAAKAIIDRLTWGGPIG